MKDDLVSKIVVDIVTQIFQGLELEGQGDILVERVVLGVENAVVRMGLLLEDQSKYAVLSPARRAEVTRLWRRRNKLKVVKT